MNNQKTVSLKFFLIFLNIILAGIQVIVLNRDSTTGVKLITLMKNYDKATHENSRLSQNIASESSIATIYLKAKEQGLGLSQKIMSLSSPLPVAFSGKLSM
ncbi:hypothetical protein A2960_01100 [Candidatus Gottesmanbacteria bacterium RIFCSPLOWO2_01_FULL_39_12b]|uniref:Cell division protein FtsL n=1 Tax=Candidatus Gottesmanbacteria bacterium RIFCSPLOWO2_01_FULL_39_12b TaxID=1798388 RepID=A0A1F6AQI1_9BACT|nr:MAG: hypothetical protein A2960_01100 [Candidatus Gottesmanbacteria bacterium RIFCSPLOWO2_01_FULL_39_12b]